MSLAPEEMFLKFITKNTESNNYMCVNLLPFLPMPVSTVTDMKLTCCNNITKQEKTENCISSEHNSLSFEFLIEFK